jgi:hypothetical protein
MRNSGGRSMYLRLVSEVIGPLSKIAPEETYGG